MTRLTSSLFPLSILLLAAGCTPPGDGDGDGNDPDPIFGDGSHSVDSIQVDVIADSGDDLMVPRDLEFHPDRPTELWILNRGDGPLDESMVVLDDPGTDDQEATYYISGGNQHFLAQGSAIAFSENGNFASIHETDIPTQGPPAQGGTPADFMGPTLWTSDRDIFDAGHGGHLDMLHSTVNGMGIAAAGGNAFWVFEGDGTVAKYDFNDDHGPGGADHSDGEYWRYNDAEVERESGVPSHMEFDADSELLYIADTGNNRICVLDTTEGEEGRVFNTYDGRGTEVDGAETNTLVEGEEVNMREPSGLALHDGMIFVSDNRTGILFAFDMDGGMLDWVDLERERAITGITFDEDGVLYLADAESEEILRIDFNTD